MWTVDYPTDARKLLQDWGVDQIAFGAWAFTDVATASRAYVHHSAWPAALCAYAAVDATFARGRFPDRYLTEMMHKIPSMDGVERTAMAFACGAPAPDLTGHAMIVFGEAVWANVTQYGLEEIFEHVHTDHAPGAHYHLRPRGIDWLEPGRPTNPAKLKAMRAAYKGLSPLRQVMALSILHLYLTRPDKNFLLGGCPTKVHGADAYRRLDNDGQALADWAHMVTHYHGW